MTCEFAEEREESGEEGVGEEVAKEGESGHDNEAVLALQILEDSVVHEQAELVTRLHQQRCQQIRHLLQRQTPRLAQVYRQDVCERSVVPQSLEVDQLHQHIHTLLRLASDAHLATDALHFLLYDFLFSGLVLCLTYGLDKVASFSTESKKGFVVLKNHVHFQTSIVISDLSVCSQ